MTHSKSPEVWSCGWQARNVDYNGLHGEKNTTLSPRKRHIKQEITHVNEINGSKLYFSCENPDSTIVPRSTVTICIYYRPSRLLNFAHAQQGISKRLAESPSPPTLPPRGRDSARRVRLGKTMYLYTRPTSLHRQHQHHKQHRHVSCSCPVSDTIW